MDNIFYEYWRECLRSHLKHVVETKDIVNELTLLTVLRDTGYSAEEIEEMRVQFGGLATPKPEIPEVVDAIAEETIGETVADSIGETQPFEEKPEQEFVAGEDEFFNPHAALAQPPPLPAERMEHFIEPVLESPVISDLPDSAISNESTESVEFVIPLERDQFDESVVQFTPDFSVMEAAPEVQAVIQEQEGAPEMPLDMPLDMPVEVVMEVGDVGSVPPDPTPLEPALPAAPKPPKPAKPPKEKPQQMSLFDL